MPTVVLFLEIPTHLFVCVLSCSFRATSIHRRPTSSGWFSFPSSLATFPSVTRHIPTVLASCLDGLPVPCLCTSSASRSFPRPAAGISSRCSAAGVLRNSRIWQPIAQRSRRVKASTRTTRRKPSVSNLPPPILRTTKFLQNKTKNIPCKKEIWN
jgi:hypothetical protein